MASLVNAMDELSIKELQEKITAAGAAVKELKTAKAPKEEITAAVKVLVDLKAQLPPELQEKPKAKKEKKKDEGQAAREAKKAAARAARGQKKKISLTEMYGDLPLMQCGKGSKTGRNYLHIKKLNGSLEGQTIWLRGYLHTKRGTGKNAFLVVRQQCNTVQCVVTKATGGADMVKYASGMNTESVIDIEGTVVKAEVNSVTQSDIEVQVVKVFTVNKAAQPAFSVSDAARPDDAVNENGEKFVAVGLDMRLDNRVIDLRTPCNQAICKVSSSVCTYFREFLLSQDFIEIQTPKLLGGTSEGGAEVFSTTYFGQPCCLAQSPQLHKQMSAACSGLERVFEIGPVFRAEDSRTTRHLCEFHGLDLEMAFYEHYHEVLDMFSDVFIYMFEKLNQNLKHEIELIREWHKFEDLVYALDTDKFPDAETSGTIPGKRTLRLNFLDGIAMLREAGVTAEEQGDYDDLSTPVEKKLGALVKEKYGVDWYFLDKFPLAFRPFYTMPDPDNDKLSNSYDFFIRGQEILSGAQRVHDADLLKKKVSEYGIPPETLKFYIDSFRTGALPHGGGGVGLERVVMLFLGLPNIRMASFFPRDPTRLTP